MNTSPLQDNPLISKTNEKILETNQNKRDNLFKLKSGDTPYPQSPQNKASSLLPYVVSNDQLQHHQSMINSQMRNDLQNYLAAKERLENKESDKYNAGGGDGIALSPVRRDYPISKSSSVKSSLCAMTR